MIREILIPTLVAAAVVTAVSLCGCAPKRAEEASSPYSWTTQGEEAGGPAGDVGEIGKATPVAKTCVPENIGPPAIRVAGKPLIPDRVLRTNDREDWPVYAPPEIVRVALPEILLREIPLGVPPAARPTAEEAKTVQPESEGNGDRSPDGH